MRLACSTLLSHFDRQVALLTPTPLLAAVAAEQFARAQIRSGLESWERPAIYSVDAWLAVCWQEARFNDPGAPSLLSAAQEHELWRGIIERQDSKLFDVGATARLASRAARIIQEWHIPSDGEAWNDHIDAQHFKHWHKLFRAMCRENGWTTRGELWNLVPQLGLRTPTVWAGFDSATPALERLRTAVGSGADLQFDAQIRERAPAVEFLAFEQEIEYAARWARAAFERNPQQSIGVFVPELAAHRALVERVFRQVFYPASRFRSRSDVIHVNLKQPLETQPLVAGALLILEFARPRIRHADAGALLRSPYLAGAQAERNVRALADIELRRRRALDFTLPELEFASAKCPRLTNVWQKVRRVFRDRRKVNELPAWSEFFGDLLEAAGWPGDSDLSGEEQEIVEAWKDALSTLAAIGMVSGPIPLDAALARLRGILKTNGIETGDLSSPVQVLDATDARGLQFDCAIVTGLSEETWPPRLNISPLLPLKLQRAYRESLQSERERATAWLFSSAPVVCATYTGRLAPQAERFVDPAVVEMPVWSGRLARQSYVPAVLEEVADGTAPPYVASESARGGTSIIKSQSLCPFRAFAEFRLAAQSPEDACFGFDARQRGGFLHEAIQRVWQELRTHARLCSIENSELRAIVHDAVTNAVGIEKAPFQQFAAAAERERLEALILEWLEIERYRKQPFTVETVEQEQYYEISGLRLRLRVDRVDRLENGRLILIDYKSGKQTRTKLEGVRPVEPQLLVYTACLGQDVDGIFFAQLKPRELRAIGFSRDPQFAGNAVKVIRDWDDFLYDSRASIEAIAAGFVAGHAAIDPIKGACEYCSVMPLCRIRERAAFAGDENEEV